MGIKFKNRLIILLCCITFSSCNATSKCLDQKACDYFEKNLSIAVTYSKLDGTIIKEDTDEVIHFLEIITGIESESEISYSGYEPPTEKDLKKWQDWYEENKDLLYWDDQKQKVKVKKE